MRNLLFAAVVGFVAFLLIPRLTDEPKEANGKTATQHNMSIDMTMLRQDIADIVRSEMEATRSEPIDMSNYVTRAEFELRFAEAAKAKNPLCDCEQCNCSPCVCGIDEGDNVHDPASSDDTLFTQPEDVPEQKTTDDEGLQRAEDLFGYTYPDGGHWEGETWVYYGTPIRKKSYSRSYTRPGAFSRRWFGVR